MKFSIIVAAYNVEEYIQRCINSIIKQSYSNLEVIIVNDGSTDQTLSVIESIKDKRIIIIDQKNGGIVKARKAGFDIATGEYILFCDGDDWLENDAIEKLYTQVLVDSPDIICFHCYRTFDSYKEEMKIYQSEVVYIKPPLKSLFLNYLLPSVCTKLIRRDFILSHNFEFPPGISYADDLAIIATLFIHHPKVTYLDEYLYNYYQRPDSITKKVSKNLLEIDTVTNYIAECLKESQQFEIYKEEFEYLIFIHEFYEPIIFAKELFNIHHELYLLYKNHQISLHRNKYIKQFLNEQPRAFRFRIKLYDANYHLGQVTDKIRNNIKKIL